MALKVSRKEFLGVDELSIPSPKVMAAKMVLDFEVAVYLEMKGQGLKQKDLAKKMGVTAATLSKTLSGTSNMTFKTAARIANALGCVLDAPMLHAFDAEEYDMLAVETETASTSSPTSTKESDYKSTVQSEARSVKKEQPVTQPAIVFVTDESKEWGLVA